MIIGDTTISAIFLMTLGGHMVIGAIAIATVFFMTWVELRSQSKSA